MARKAALPIRKTPSGTYAFDLPQDLSPTGSRQRRTFRTKREADFARSKILEQHRLHGVESLSIPASLAQEAVKAAALLDISASTIYRKRQAWEEAQQA